MDFDEARMSVRWVLIDGLNAAHRAFHAYSGLATNDGRPSGLEHGFLLNLCKRQEEFPNAALVVVWEGRHEHNLIYPEYKGQRDRTAWQAADGPERCRILREVCRGLVGNAHHPKKEADGVITGLTELDGVVGIFSSDDDFLALTVPRPNDPPDHRVFVFQPKLKGAIDFWDALRFQQEFDIPADRWSYYKAFLGDTSDNLPGVWRIPNAFQRQVIRDVHFQPGQDPFQAIVAQAIRGKASYGQRYQDHLAQARLNYRIMDLGQHRTLDDIQFSMPTGDATLAKALCEDLQLNQVSMVAPWAAFTRSWADRGYLEGAFNGRRADFAATA